MAKNRYRRALLLAAATLTAAPFAAGQAPKFTVASVKDCRGGGPRIPTITSPGTLSLNCANLNLLIAQAYDTFASGKVDLSKPLSPDPLDGAPTWTNTANYSIEAKADGRPSPAMMRGPMMQALLEQRFHVRVEREKREVDGYVMTVAGKSPNLRPAAEGGCAVIDPSDLSASHDTGGKPMCRYIQVSGRNGRLVLDAHGITIDAFASRMRPDGKPVINHTGLEGVYDIHLEYDLDAPNDQDRADGGASDPDPKTSALVAMRRQLGLRITPGRFVRDTLVVKHIERPDPN